MYEYITLVSDWRVLYCMDIPYIVYAFTTLVVSTFLAIVNNAAMNIYVEVFVQPCFKLLGEYLWVELLSCMLALLEKEIATHSSILAWKIPWTEEPGGLQVQGVAKSWTRLSNFTSLHFSSVFNPFEELLIPNCFAKQLHQFTFPNAMCGGSNFFVRFWYFFSFSLPAMPVCLVMSDCLRPFGL